MYTILVDENHALITTNKERVMQNSQGVNTLVFLVKPEMNGLIISNCTVVFEYWTPVLNKYDNRILEPVGDYNGYLQYEVPFDLKLTSEHGDLQVQLSFIYVDLDADGNSVQKVKKTNVSKIKITPIAAWSNMLPDSGFTALDQRIIKTDAQLKAAIELVGNKADDLKYDEEMNSLQLISGDKEIGQKVILNSNANLEDGVPIVDFNNFSFDDNHDNNHEDDNVVEF